MAPLIASVHGSGLLEFEVLGHFAGNQYRLQTVPFGGQERQGRPPEPDGTPVGSADMFVEALGCDR